MDRAKEAEEHAALLRRAIGAAGLTGQELATAIGVSARTIVNWTSRVKPTMPSEKDQEQLRRLLPGYADQGDPVEIALRRAELAPFRQAEVIAVYQRALHEQALEDKRLG
jgi:transcriptional regulator with XRE-family HTH domain